MKEVFEYIISLLKSRIFPMILVFIVLISVLVHRLFVLQIINGDSYDVSGNYHAAGFFVNRAGGRRLKVAV